MGRKKFPRPVGALHVGEAGLILSETEINPRPPRDLQHAGPEW